MWGVIGDSGARLGIDFRHCSRTDSGPIKIGLSAEVEMNLPRTSCLLAILRNNLSEPSESQYAPARKVIPASWGRSAFRGWRRDECFPSHMIQPQEERRGRSRRAFMSTLNKIRTVSRVNTLSMDTPRPRRDDVKIRRGSQPSIPPEPKFELSFRRGRDQVRAPLRCTPTPQVTLFPKGGSSRRQRFMLHPHPGTAAACSRPHLDDGRVGATFTAFRVAWREAARARE